jgi:hypothetical protein
MTLGTAELLANRVEQPPTHKKRHHRGVKPILS